ncbi:MAG: NHLP family bacteriocin export ABC transporter peptidase/permease/ATPase subunit [Armatimonadetes bacterium]|nr:NHLP family bacteriocin export ABC transporter peptidase/permease/ATPase subunit [Armatimonadota bacterium]
MRLAFWRAWGRRVRTPTVIQMEAVECGAASLAIVLGYYGRIVPLEELRLACGVSRDGSKALNVVKAARDYGLVARAFRKEPADLKDLPLPMIVFWAFNHFLVVEGFENGKVYLNDPGSGPRTVTEEEFDRNFTGIVLTFEVGPEFKKGGERPSLAGMLRARLTGAEAVVVYVIIAGLLLVVPGLVTPVFSTVFIDRVLIGGLGNWAEPLLRVMGITLAIIVALQALERYHIMRLGQKLTIASAGQFMWHALRLPAEFFSLRYAGDVVSRMQANEELAQFLSGQLPAQLLSLITVVFYAFVMLQYNVPLTLIVIASALLNVVALKYVSRKRVDINLRLQQDWGKLMSTAFGGLQMIETLKATSTEDDFFARWAGFQAKVLTARQELGAYTQYLAAVPALLTSLTTVAVLAIGGEIVIAGGLTLGLLIAFQSLMGSFSAPIDNVVTLGSRLQELEASMNRLNDVLRYRADPLATPPSPDGEQATDATVKLSGHLDLRNVAFGYSRLAPPLIENLNLTLAPGARVALVGTSGSGKSTVAKLVSGLYEPWGGEILFDGRARQAYARAVTANSLAMVDQDIFLFEGTVQDNLTLWDPTIPDAQMVQAARDAGIHDDIAARPGGYDSRVEEGGANFSGGQRQRLEIARALMGTPSLLILDEATSALDPVTEKLIDDNLRRRGCACLIVAHRLSTIRDCDEIIVLDQGKVVQRGTHDQLRAAEGAYARLIAVE